LPYDIDTPRYCRHLLLIFIDYRCQSLPRYHAIRHHYDIAAITAANSLFSFAAMLYISFLYYYHAATLLPYITSSIDAIYCHGDTLR